MVFPSLAPTDIKTAIMGETGADIKMSPLAQRTIPFSFECKNTEQGFTALYKAYAQAIDNTEEQTPVVIVKQNNRPILAILDIRDFFELIKGK